MKKNYYTYFGMLMLFLCYGNQTRAQVINVPEIIQEQSQWCWAGSTKCVLDYYNFNYNQCTIADYARTVATWHNYGSTNCCTNASLGCNYWNYNWGSAGSMEDILQHFGNIHTNNIFSALSMTAIMGEVYELRPFIFRWAWTGGGGHFMVGHGISGTDMYYMNPLPGYGYEIANYNWVVNDGGNHTWTHTQTLAINTGVNEIKTAPTIELYPNPTAGMFTLRTSEVMTNAQIRISTTLGKLVYADVFSTSATQIFQLKDLAPGIYIIKIQDGNKEYTKKLAVQ